MKNLQRVLLIIAVPMLAGLGFIVGSYRKSYLISRFDLVVATSTELKLRDHKYGVLHDENALRLWSAYQTIQSLPAWCSVFRTHGGMSKKQQEEFSAVMHDLLLQHSKNDLDKGDLKAFVEKHLGEASSNQSATP
jgi:hypothetical protein